jgi:signal transduction histidine kinase/CheY-like chemotaxis protein
MHVEARPSGLPVVGDVTWGSHLCHFYRTQEELAESLVPYLHAGLQNHEQCLWITSKALRAKEARSSLLRAIPDLDLFLARDQIQIMELEEWYERTGGGDPEGTVAAWLEHEAQALKQGFAGLRVTDTSGGIGGGDRSALGRHEARVHEAFQDRRIIGLCSYSLESCGTDEIMDILRNHKFAIVRRGGSWEVAHSATGLLAAAAPREVVSRRRPAQHTVQFYEQHAFLGGRIAEYAAEGLRAGEAVLLITDTPTTPLVLEALASDRPVAEDLVEGRLVLADARTTLSTFMSDGQPDAGRFEAAIGALAAPLLAAHPRARAYGEMVNVLVQDGNVEGAAELERLWDTFLRGKPLTLLCGYELSALDQGAVRQVAAAHHAVIPAESLAEFAHVEPGRLIGELQHQTHLLQTEARVRRLLERERSDLLLAEQRARAEAERAMSHLARLQAVTEALSRAATPADIAGVVVTEMAQAAGAQRAVLAVAGAEEGKLTLLGQVGLEGGAAAGASEFPADALLPIAAAFRTGQPVWLTSPEAIGAEFASTLGTGAQAIASLPLQLGGKRLGAVGFGYAQPREFSPQERALLLDLARQATLALDRSRLLLRAEQANRTKDEFLAMLGHELRNPLSPIVTSLQLVRLRGGQPSFGRELDVIERQTRHLVRLVDDLLDVSRITQGRVRLERERIETAEVVARAVEMARPLIEQRAHQLCVAVATAGLTLEVDAQRAAQVLANLLINAAKYTEPGGRIAVDASHEGEEVVIHVRDNGRGIPADLLPRVFDLFVQGSRSPDRREGGLGVGLSVARGIVELHGGSISVRSEGEGKGSAFAVRLPLLAHAAEPLAAGGEPATAPMAEGTRVLIVDDNQDGADALAQGLRHLGHVVRVAYDSASGLAAAEEFAPTVALLDIGLPVLDGYDLAAQMRQRSAGRPLGLIALTGYGGEIDRRRSAAAGFNAHIVKPADLAHVHSEVEALAAGETSAAHQPQG